MSLRATNLYIQMSPIPVTFQGTPNDLAAEMIRRMKILSPSGTNFIFIGDVEPTSNVGPWLKNGTKWYVWNDSANGYVPLDVSDSIAASFAIGRTAPISTPPALWLQTTQDATDTNPNYGLPVSWKLWTGTEWVTFNSVTFSGPTSLRPENPVDFQQYYDTDIAALIWWERNLWRTVSGVPGDVKSVVTLTLDDALTKNPGWDYLGRSDINQRGRAVFQATKDPGASPVENFTPASGVTERAAGDVFGATFHIKEDNTSTVLDTPGLALWHLVKL